MLITELRLKIEKIERTIAEIQTDCSHPAGARSVVDENTDDSGLDQFPVTTTRYLCGLCELRWSEKTS